MKLTTEQVRVLAMLTVLLSMSLSADLLPLTNEECESVNQCLFGTAITPWTEEHAPHREFIEPPRQVVVTQVASTVVSSTAAVNFESLATVTKSATVPTESV